MIDFALARRAGRATTCFITALATAPVKNGPLRLGIIAGLLAAGTGARYVEAHYADFSPQTPVYTAARCTIVTDDGRKGVMRTELADMSDMTLAARDVEDVFNTYDRPASLLGRLYDGVTGGDGMAHYTDAEAVLRQCADFIMEHQGVGMTRVMPVLSSATAGTHTGWMGQVVDNPTQSYTLGNKWHASDAARELNRMADQAHQIQTRQAEQSGDAINIWRNIWDNGLAQTDFVKGLRHAL